MNKFRILFIVENATVPQDIRVWREARTLKQAGYDVTTISPKNKYFSKSYEVIDGIEIYRHPSFKGDGGKLHQIMEYTNALFWEAILGLKVFIKNRFFIIHGANPPDHIFLLALAFNIFDVKFIFDHHDLAPELFYSKYNARKKTIFRLLSLMEKLSCRIAHAVISTNLSYKKHIIDKHGINPDKIFVVRNDPELSGNSKSVNYKQHRDDEIIELLYVGAINNQDGVDLLIRTMDILVNQLNETRMHCTVVGDGDDMPRVRKLCTELRMEPYFRFTGFIHDRKLVQNFIEEADICVETASKSEANRKSTFIKIMEYMSAGKPIVAFDMDETRYSTQESALLVEPGNLTQFAQAIVRLSKDPDLRKRIGEYGFERIAKSLNWENSAAELLRAYNYLLERV
ncbi:MAG: glycosyltransferase family 4 protein [Desulfatirhabdiaceae bacterium]